MGRAIAPLRSDQDRPAPSGLTGRDVHPGIADEPGSAEVHSELRRGDEEQSRQRLAALAVNGERLHLAAGQVRTDIEARKPAAEALDLALEVAAEPVEV